MQKHIAAKIFRESKKYFAEKVTAGINITALNFIVTLNPDSMIMRKKVKEIVPKKAAIGDIPKYLRKKKRMIPLNLIPDEYHSKIFTKPVYQTIK